MQPEIAASVIIMNFLRHFFCKTIFLNSFLRLAAIKAKPKWLKNFTDYQVQTTVPFLELANIKLWFDDSTTKDRVIETEFERLIDTQRLFNEVFWF